MVESKVRLSSGRRGGLVVRSPTKKYHLATLPTGRPRLRVAKGRGAAGKQGLEESFYASEMNRASENECWRRGK